MFWIRKCSAFLFHPGRGRGGGWLPNKGWYGCAASAKPRPGKISQKNLMPRQKVPKNLMSGQVFMNLRLPKLEFFTFFTLLSNITHFLSKIVKNLMPGQFSPPKTHSPPQRHLIVYALDLAWRFVPCSLPRYSVRSSESLRRRVPKT